MSSLKSLQDDFQKAILEGDAGILSVIPNSAKESRETLLSVYQNAYVWRLIEFLQNDYEKLHLILGEEKFAELASAYAYAVPSNNPNGRWFGSKLPEYLSETAPYSDRLELCELAVLERALNDVFDAADAEPLTLADLASVPPEAWGELVFSFQPATRVLEFKTNAVDLWSALHNDTALPSVCEMEEPVHVVCYREERMSKFRFMSHEEAILWREAVKGTSFAGLCEIGATYGGEDGAAERAAGILHNWISAGLLKKPDISQ